MKNQIPTFVKWAGGKKQLIEQFKPFFPENIDRYLEPFVGGGAVLFYILKKYKPKEVFIFDINAELINTYEVIKNDVENLIKELKKLKEIHSKENYYKIREEDPKLLSPLTRASRFIYLNKTCFNGLYRVNSKGGFNVPFNNSKNPLICPEIDLREISKLLQDVKIINKGFEECLKYADKNSFVYFDPPYYPLKKGKSFTTYTKGNFLEKEQKQLKEVFSKLDKKGCKVMLSNSDTDFIKGVYKNYNIRFVNANRMINCDGKGRGKIKEIVVTNY
ncbi:MAG TPA: DNA adenine methylase [Candidatus Nanoarchaeia archaeon]|nr:DNA adenine methylase [Candidatus Nanoarchaeia archaeon]